MVQSLHLLSSESHWDAACLSQVKRLTLIIMLQATALATTAAAANDAVCSARQLLGQQKSSFA